MVILVGLPRLVATPTRCAVSIFASEIPVQLELAEACREIGAWGKGRVEVGVVGASRRGNWGGRGMERSGRWAVSGVVGARWGREGGHVRWKWGFDTEVVLAGLERVGVKGERERYGSDVGTPGRLKLSFPWYWMTSDLEQCVVIDCRLGWMIA
jgi:hypothetical protein